MDKRILMVCLGNICRSPIAGGVMEAKLEKYSIQCIVDTAGISSYHSGQAPDYRAVKISAAYGIDISGQKARRISKADYENFDFIFAMDQSVYESVVQGAPTPAHAKKVHLFLEYAGHPQGTEVPDPYYSGHEAFDQVFQLIDTACENIIRKWYPELKT